MGRFLHISVALLFLCCSVASVIAQEMDRGRPDGIEQRLDVSEEDILGAKLMTDQEIADYRQTMQELETEEEREAFRREHSELMRERARLLGVTLEEEPRHRTVPDPLRIIPDDRAQHPGHFREGKP